MTLIERLKDEQKAAMKAKNKPRLGAIRLVMAAIKQREVDEKITLSEDDVLAVLTKMVKQRRDSVAQYEAANRQDLADVELAEISVLEEFMPQPLSDDEVAALLDEPGDLVGVDAERLPVDDGARCVGDLERVGHGVRKAHLPVHDVRVLRIGARTGCREQTNHQTEREYANAHASSPRLSLR